MILSCSKIESELKTGNILIDPFARRNLNSNSYNLTLDDKLLVYEAPVLDMGARHKMKEIIIPQNGFQMCPNELYLASTVERTVTNKYIPMIEGRSSVARLGLFVHITAGLGEAGFDGHWTLELHCVKPLVIYPCIQICQIYFHEVNCLKSDLDFCRSKKYQNNNGVQASRLHYEKEDWGNRDVK